MIEIDGSQGEGGGQILRTALSLSLCLHRPFRITHIRQSRPKPGLRPQHLVAVEAAARIGQAVTRGAELNSTQLEFTPGRIESGRHEFDIGTAGSTTLVLQTLLPALMQADAPSELVIHGGTHNPFAPPFEFLEQAFLPLLERMGVGLELQLQRHGFYPAGGGCLRLRVTPRGPLQPLHLQQRGRLLQRRARVLMCRLPEHIARRELAVLQRELGLSEEACSIEWLEDSPTPANVLMLSLQSEHVCEHFTALGRRGVPAEEVAGELAAEAQRYLAAGVPVGEYLADQLLLPLVLAGGGSFRTLPPSLHTRTNIEVIRRFIDIPITLQQESDEAWRIAIG